MYGLSHADSVLVCSFGSSIDYGCIRTRLQVAVFVVVGKNSYLGEIATENVGVVTGLFIFSNA